MTIKRALIITALIALLLLALSDKLTGISEICAYYGGNLPECKN